MSHRIRVAYLPAALRPGGAERQMLALAKRLPKDRFQVDFVAIAGSGDYDGEAETAGSRVHVLGAGMRPGSSLPVRVARRAHKTLRYVAIARKRHYDVIDAWLYPSDVLAALGRPFTGTPVIVAGRRNIDPLDQFGILEGTIGAAVRRMTDMVVANSSAAAQHAITRQGLDPAKVRIIRNGVELPGLVTEAQRSAIRRDAFGIIDDTILIGCVANYRDVKRLDLLIDAVAPLIREGLPIRLDLIGEGPMRAELEHRVDEAMIRERVCFHGSVLQPELLYAAFDIAVQTSEREGLPNVLLEAAAAGRAIVATNAGGSSEIVLDGRSGLLVPVGDVDAIGNGIRQLVMDAGLRDRLGATARDHVARTFGMDRFVGEFAALYEQLVATKRRST